MAVQPLRTSMPPNGPEPPRVGPLPLREAVRRQLPIAILPVLVLVALACLIALIRSPEYTSEARLNVGGLNLTQQTIESYTATVQGLAVSYSRSIDAAGVVTPVSRELDIPPADVIDRVSATPIQGSPVIDVRATAGEAEEAQRLADAAADALAAYAIELNSGRRVSRQLRARFRAASQEFRSARAELAGAGAEDREALQTRVDTARLEMQTVGFLYQQSQAGEATLDLVQKLAPASAAESDRGDFLQDLLAGALIAGLLIGIGLAAARANAVARRRLGES